MHLKMSLTKCRPLYSSHILVNTPCCYLCRYDCVLSICAFTRDLLIHLQQVGVFIFFRVQLGVMQQLMCTLAQVSWHFVIWKHSLAQNTPLMTTLKWKVTSIFHRAKLHAIMEHKFEVYNHKYVILYTWAKKHWENCCVSLKIKYHVQSSLINNRHGESHSYIFVSLEYTGNNELYYESDMHFVHHFTYIVLYVYLCIILFLTKSWRLNKIRMIMLSVSDRSVLGSRCDRNL